MNLQKFIISVIIVGITLVIGIYINDSIGSTINDSTLQSFSVTNETGGFINLTGYTLAGYSADNFTIGTVVIINATSNQTLLAANYTITNGVLRNATTVNYATVKITYDYKTGTPNSQSATTDAATEVVSALSTGTSWISILVVVGFATIILTMLTSGLGSATRRENELPYY